MSNQIIACIDSSLSSAAVCDWASWASIKLKQPLTLLHALDEVPEVAQTNLSGNIGLDSREKLLEELAALDEQRNKLALQQGKQLLENAQKRVIAKAAKEVRCLQRHGRLVDTLLELEKEIKLLVIGRQGEETQMRAAQIGSQLETIIRTLHCPILVALPDYQQPKQVMFAFDASPTAHKIRKKLVDNSHLLQGVSCHLVMVNNVSHESQFLEAQALLKKAGIEVVGCLLEGQVEDTLCHYIDEHQIDLLIMGAYGHSRIRQFLVGSTTSHLLHKTKIPLLLLR